MKNDELKIWICLLVLMVGEESRIQPSVSRSPNPPSILSRFRADGRTHTTFDQGDQTSSAEQKIHEFPGRCKNKFSKLLIKLVGAVGIEPTTSPV